MKVKVTGSWIFMLKKKKRKHCVQCPTFTKERQETKKKKKSMDYLNVLMKPMCR